MHDQSADALKLVMDTAVKAKAPELVDFEHGPNHKQLLVLENGDTRVVDSPPMDRDHRFETLGSLHEFANAAIAGKHGLAKPVVWFDESCVSVVVDDDERRGRGALELKFTAPFLLLCDGQSKTPRTQTDFVRFLRIEMAGTLPPDGNLLRLIRECKFNSSRTGEGSVQHGKDAMSQALTAEVRGLDVLPETVRLNVRVFVTPDITAVYPIVCALDIQSHEQTFRLVPLPMECENALARAVDDIGEVLSGLDCPVYRGRA